MKTRNTWNLYDANKTKRQTAQSSIRHTWR